MKNHCPHCHPYKPTHLDDKLAFTAELYLRPVRVLVTQSLEIAVWTIILRIFEITRLGKWKKTSSEEFEGKWKCLVNSAENRNYKTERFNFLNHQTTTLRIQAKKPILIEGELPSNNRGFHQAINDKAAMRKLLKKHNIPIPRGGAYWLTRSAQKKAETLNDFIIKPRDGSLSKHISIKPKDTKKAIKIAKQICPSVIVEEYIEGPVYRATTVHGKFEAATLRIPEKKGGKVIMAAGSKMIDITDEIPKENIELFEKIAKIVGGAILGIDIIATDLKTPHDKQKNFAIIELNSWPSIDMHHNPDQGKPRDIMGIYLDNLK